MSVYFRRLRAPINMLHDFNTAVKSVSDVIAAFDAPGIVHFSVSSVISVKSDIKFPDLELGNELWKQLPSVYPVQRNTLEKYGKLTFFNKKVFRCHRLSLPGGLSFPEAAITIAGTNPQP